MTEKENHLPNLSSEERAHALDLPYRLAGAMQHSKLA